MSSEAPIGSFNTRADHRSGAISLFADRYLFFVVFIVGTGVTLLLKSMGFAQLWVTLVPVSAMALYALYVAITPRYRLRGDRAGDSLYYLGFLFTMVSLAYSLYEFGTVEGATEKLITNFGIALSTTILGLAARVIFHQLREDPFDIEREVRVDLAETAAGLHSELLRTLRDFEGLRVAIAQSVSESTAAATERMTAAVDQASQKHIKGAALLLETAESAAKSLLATHNAMGAAGKRTIVALDKLAERIENTQAPTAQLQKKFDALHERLEAILQSLAKRADDERDTIQKLGLLLKEMLTTADTLRTQLGNLSQASHGHQQWIQKATTEVQKATDDLQKAAATMLQQTKSNVETQRDLIGGLMTTAADTLQAVQHHRVQLEAELKTSTSLVSQVHGSLASLAKLVVEKLDAKQRRI